ncbi:phosphate ABC transporter ATP-binding protein [Methanocella sp. CWC-04]|uniref:Phosphate ABC transporter ATP-binding protein n=1 Tax=Methanooceanicella nereidis TaxID=2052831 RepID=A0AAP2REE1_9EURY|nr:phosphate ABC transporter ATP-binding protein [Methanocella sp. CWC-04]MCD1294520.1 phosphate ABC transporter ATP-binding protein [Methanocella sp. CWC-04]
MSSVTVENLTRIAGDRAILNNVNLKIDSGDIMAVIGPSGAGKTTLLRLINMLDIPDRGKVYIDGKDVWSGHIMETRMSMSMVFQKPIVFSMNVYDNIAYGLKLRHESKSKIEKRIKDVMELLDLSGKERQYAKDLSGGEAQRVAFARAYVLKPRILLLDEPTASLDPLNVAIIEKAVNDVNEKFGTTVIIVTHNLHQAKRLANKATFLYEGNLVETGSIEDIFNNPRDKRTKAFVTGDMVF